MLRRQRHSVLLLAASAALGAVAFLDVSALVLCLLLPPLLVARPWRWWPLAVAAVFFMAANAPLITVLDRWGSGTGEAVSPIAQWGYPLLLSALLAAPFGLINPTASPAWRAAQCALALLALTLPPIGFVAWLNPLAVAGVLFPGAGLAGLAMTLGVLALLAAHAWKRQAPRFPWPPSSRSRWQRSSPPDWSSPSATWSPCRFMVDPSSARRPTSPTTAPSCCCSPAR